MIIVEGWIRLATPAEVDRVRAAAIAMMAATRAEPGCLDYAFSHDLAEPTLLRLIERWRDEAALTEHFAAPHMATFNAAMQGAAITGMLVKAYAGTEIRTLIER